MNVFVYGTLKRGGRFHEMCCADAIGVMPAETTGRLYSLGSFPALVVPDESKLRVGSWDYRADAAFTAATPPDIPKAEGIWRTIHGELISFPENSDSLVRMDGLEGFRLIPERSHYMRHLIPVTAVGKTVLAWTYTMEMDWVEGRELIEDGVFRLSPRPVAVVNSC